MERVEKITDKQGIYLTALFFMGSTLIVGTGGSAKNDAWIAGVLGMIIVLPVILLYSRLLSIMPGKDLFEMLEFIFGKPAGKIVSLLYIWYAFHLGALVIRNFGEFINTVAMPETPILVPILFLGICCLVNVRAGVEVIGRMSTFLFPTLVFILIAVQLLAIPVLEPDNILPVLSHGMTPIFDGAFSAFAFPFAESVLLLTVLYSVKSTKAPYKVYFTGILIAGTLIIVLTLRNIMVLGDLLGKMHFPSYLAVSRIKVGNFLQRIEVTVSYVFVVAAFMKASICLFAVSKGISRLFKLESYKNIVLQTGLLMVLFSYIIYDNIMEMRMWAFDIYPYYAFPFQVILPLIIWVTAEFKVKKIHSGDSKPQVKD